MKKTITRVNNSSSLIVNNRILGMMIYYYLIVYRTITGVTSCIHPLALLFNDCRI